MAEENITEIEFEGRGRNVFLVVVCNTVTKLLDQNTIVNLFEQSKYRNCAKQLDKLSDFITTTNELIEKIQQHQDRIQKVDFHFATILDASISFEISEDLMSATANVVTAQGGKRLSMAEIKRACLEYNIKFGLKTTLVKRLLKNVRGLPPGTKVKQLLVKGKPASDGIDAELKPKVNMFGEQLRQHRINPDGSFNLRDLGEIETVKKGQVVAYKTQPSKGLEGKDILGNVLIPTPGNDFELKATQGTEISEDDPNCLVAICEGMLRKTGEKLVVDDVFVINELTAKQGHIDFHGSVIIEGDVAAEMKIEATGDVYVGGFVESAIIRCHGNLTIIGGCVGHIVNKGTKSELETDLSCELVSGQNINVDFASQVFFRCKFDVMANKYLANCKVVAKSLIVGDPEKPQGKVIGGKFTLSKLLNVGILGGSETNIPVDINMNRVYDVFLQKEHELWEWTNVLEQRVGELKKKISTIDNPTEKTIEDKKLLILITKVKKYIYFRRVLIEKRAEYINEIKVLAHRQLYRNVSVKIGQKAMITNERKSASVIRKLDSNIVIEPL